MPKATDITGTFRIPQEQWGSFWNFMLSIDGADITPNTRTKAAPAARGSKKDGSTGRCIVLAALSNDQRLTAKQLNEFMIKQGKAPSIGGLLHNMVNKTKELTRNDKGYAITAKGRKYLETNCKL